jgi:hypothetical protein
MNDKKPSGVLRNLSRSETARGARGIEGGAKRATAAGRGRSDSAAPQSPVFFGEAEKNARMSFEKNPE